MCTTGSSEITTEAEWRHWTVEEEEALRRAIKKFGPGCWKEIKESEPVLATLSTSQIKHKVINHLERSKDFTNIKTGLE